MNRLIIFATFSSFIALSGCTQKPKEYTGRIKIDAGTEYAALEYSSGIGGACEGWSNLEIRKPGTSSGLANVLCWKRDGEYIVTNDRTGTQRHSSPAAYWTD